MSIILIEHQVSFIHSHLNELFVLDLQQYLAGKDLPVDELEEVDLPGLVEATTGINFLKPTPELDAEIHVPPNPHHQMIHKQKPLIDNPDEAFQANQFLQISKIAGGRKTSIEEDKEKDRDKEQWREEERSALVNGSVLGGVTPTKEPQNFNAIAVTGCSVIKPAPGRELDSKAEAEGKKFGNKIYKKSTVAPGKEGKNFGAKLGANLAITVIILN
jgi:hypothetical protein